MIPFLKSLALRHGTNLNSIAAHRDWHSMIDDQNLKHAKQNIYDRINLSRFLLELMERGDFHTISGTSHQFVEINQTFWPTLDRINVNIKATRVHTSR